MFSKEVRCMYEILAGKRTVNGIPITTWKREITNANILEVEVGSTGFQGGDTGCEGGGGAADSQKSVD